MNYLVRWIEKLGNDVRARLRIHISCREAAWVRADRDKWFGLFPSGKKATLDEVGTDDDTRGGCIPVELLDLTETEINQFCTEKGIEPSSFLSQIPARLLKLIARPQTLNYLVEDYMYDPPKFSGDIIDLLERIIDRRLQDPNEIYQRSEISTTGVSVKRKIAEHYALTSILTNREIIALDNESNHGEIPAELSGHGMKAERETFKTDLFQPYQEGRFRFKEPELAEYLAARKLDRLIRDDILSSSRTIRLFFPALQSDYPVPILRDLTGCLCSLNPDFRKQVIEKNPVILLNDYTGELGNEDRVAIWKWILKSYGTRNWFDDSDWQDCIGVLACEELVPDLLEVISDRDEYGIPIRILALKIAKDGRLEKCVPAIESLVPDFSEHQHIISFAGITLAAIDPGRAKRLKPWLDLSRENDPDDLLLCQALESLWPDHIDLKTLINSLKPSTYTNSATYRLFLKDLPKRLNSSQRKEVIDALCRKLTQRIESGKNSRKEGSAFPTAVYPSDFLSHFLLEQIKDWKDRFDQIPLIEKWLHVLDKARESGLISGRDAYASIRQEIEKAHRLRQSLCKQNVLRVYEEKGITFAPDQFYWDVFKSFHPQKEDLKFWKQSIERWDNEYPSLLSIAWKAFMSSWKQNDYPYEFVDWIEDFAERNPTIRSVWQQDNRCSLENEHAKWNRDKAQNEKKRQAKRNKVKEEVCGNINKIRSGDIQWMVMFTNHHYEDPDGRYEPSKSQAANIATEFGDEIRDAYLEGLQVLWRSGELPELSEYYLTGSTPYEIFCIMQAVDEWTKAKSNIWREVSRNLRKKALQAGISELNSFPDWYLYLINEEIEIAESLWLSVLDLESKSTQNHAHLANLISYNKDFPLSQTVAKKYLLEDSVRHVRVTKPLIKTIMRDQIDGDLLSFLSDRGTINTEIVAIEENLHYLAAAWRYDPASVWKWIEEYYLSPSEDRSGNFTKWVMELESIHDDMGIHRWPAWSDPKVLLSMLPDFLAIDLPHSRGGTVSNQDRMRFLRDDLINRISESGDHEIAEEIQNLLDHEESQFNKNVLMDALDHIKKTYPSKIWLPFEPQELWDFIERDKRPARNHLELCLLVEKMLLDIKTRIESGASNLKVLLWDPTKAKGKSSRPAPEKKFQVLIYDQIENHRLMKQFFGAREIEITDGKKPDITIVCKSHTNETLKVYIELKRQRHPELITSIKDQLADKYLIDPEARYGFYVAGWYGSTYYGPIKKRLKDVCRHVPTNPSDLELCLQKIADQTSTHRHDIDLIKVFVIDASQN